MMKTINTQKRVIISLLLFTFSFLQVGAKGNSMAQDEKTAYFKIWVDGMACPFCAYGLEKRIKKIKGAEDLYVDINEGFITFAVPIDKKPSEEYLKKIVKEAGFTARKIEYAETPFKTEKDE